MKNTRLPSLFASEPFVFDDAFRTFMRPFRWEWPPKTPQIKKDVEETKEGRLLRSERSYGFASRSFSLGYEIDRAKAVAKYENGVLMLTLPKLMSAHVEPLKIM